MWPRVPSTARQASTWRFMSQLGIGGLGGPVPLVRQADLQPASDHGLELATRVAQGMCHNPTTPPRSHIVSHSLLAVA